MRRILLLITIPLCFHNAGFAATSAESFLIPGVDFSKLDLQEGAWCRYVVVDEALGQIDSSEIYIGVPSREMTSRGEAFWVEIETRPVGGSFGEADVLKLLVLEKIRAFDSGDSLGDYVVKLYNRTGDRPPREEDPKRFKRFSQVIPTTDSSWVSTPDVLEGATGSELSCVKKKRTVRDDREVVTGKVRLIKKARDDFAVWFCDDIPVFHLAKCEIVRVRETETLPKITGVPNLGKKVATTTAALVAFGFDATPILSVER
ncbi:MAG: hypothetical protein OEN01_14170 [Candidatus Krumholzibacteria bacterium]|nr:hypothetical protein [Candidatus Krumholzibacteria bacterium]